MSIIDRIELYFVRMPLPAPIKLAWIPGYEGEATQHYIIRLVTDDGVEGWSAMSAGTLERAGMGDSYCNMLMGIDATDIDLVTERIKVMASTGNNEMWIEPASGTSRANWPASLFMNSSAARQSRWNSTRLQVM